MKSIDLSLSFEVLCDLTLPARPWGLFIIHPSASYHVNVLIPLPINFFPFPVFYCGEMHPSQSIREKHTFSVSFLNSTLLAFLFLVVVCLFISVLSFCISISGFFFSISQMLV